MANNSRRNFLAKTLGLGALTSATAASFANNILAPGNGPVTLPSLKGRKVLFTYGGWAGHEPQKLAEYFYPWLKEEGAEVLLFETLDPYTDKTLMASIDLVIQVFTMAQITKEQETGLIEAIEKNGTGMAGWHGGMCDSFRNNPDYQFMTGGQWVAHPGGVINYQINIVDQKDEVTKGIKDFSIHTEQYYMHVDPNVKVLATTRFNGQAKTWIDGCVMPVTWKKMHGKGRIFYTSVAHTLNQLIEKQEAIEMLKRGIRWASASKYEPVEKWLYPVYGQLKK